MNNLQNEIDQMDAALAARLAKRPKDFGANYALRKPFPSHVEKVLEVAPEQAQKEFVHSMLSGSQAKTAFAIRHNAERMISEDGVESVAFLTLTVGDRNAEGRFVQVHDSDEANRRINNLNRRILSVLFERAIVVTERHSSGAVHFHVLGTLAGRPDIRTGFDWNRVEKGDYRSVSERLRRVWAFLRETLPAYGFGRAETMPIRTCSGALSRYIAKYIEKNVCNRLKEDKHKKLVRYIGWEKKQLKPNEFGWAGPRARAWRAKTRQLAGIIGIYQPEQAAEFFGPRWAWHLSETWGRLFGVKDIYPGILLDPVEFIKVKEILTQKRESRFRAQLSPPLAPTNSEWFLEMLDDPEFLEWLEGNFGPHSRERQREMQAAQMVAEWNAWSN